MSALRCCLSYWQRAWVDKRFLLKPASKRVRLCRFYSLCHSYSSLPFQPRPAICSTVIDGHGSIPIKMYCLRTACVLDLDRGLQFANLWAQVVESMLVSLFLKSEINSCLQSCSCSLFSLNAYKSTLQGIPWWSSSQDSVLPFQGPGFIPGRELRYYKSTSIAKKINTVIFYSFCLQFYPKRINCQLLISKAL